MQFFLVILGALAAVANASGTNTPSTSLATIAPPSSLLLAPSPTGTPTTLQNCLEACKTDVNCKAKCVSVPSPNAQQVNQTNTCVAQCPQGHGTAADIQVYSKCRDQCIAQNYFASGGTPSPTNAPGNSVVIAYASTTLSFATTGTAASAVTTGTNPGATTTGPNSPPATQSPHSAASRGLVVSSVGLVGLIAAMLAL